MRSSANRKTIRNNTPNSNPTSANNILNNQGTTDIDIFPSQGLNQTNGEESSISLAAKVAMLEKDLERRQESYISRERAYKVRIDELEEELTNQKQSKTGWMKSDPKV